MVCDRPFNAIEGHGIMEMADALIEVDATYDKVNAKDVLLSRYTLIKEKLKIRNRLSVEEMMEKVKQAICD